MFFFFNDTATTEIYTLSLHDALPIYFISSEQSGHGLYFLWIVPGARRAARVIADSPGGKVACTHIYRAVLTHPNNDSAQLVAFRSAIFQVRVVVGHVAHALPDARHGYRQRRGCWRLFFYRCFFHHNFLLNHRYLPSFVHVYIVAKRLHAIAVNRERYIMPHHLRNLWFGLPAIIVSLFLQFRSVLRYSVLLTIR